MTLWVDVLVPQGCCNRLPQTGQLKTTGICCFNSYKSKIKLLTGLALGALREEPVLSLLPKWRMLPILGAPWLVGSLPESVPHHHMAFLPVCVFSSSYNDTSHIGFGVHANLVWPHLDCLYLQTSKLGHILEFWVAMNLGGILFNTVQSGNTPAESRRLVLPCKLGSGRQASPGRMGSAE